MEVVQFVVLGLVIGVFSGVVGVRGAVFLVPILVYVFGWQQHMAQGTALAMLIPPIGILAVWQYWSAGHVDIRVAGLMCVGFFIGGYFGGLVANHLPAETLRKIFGAALFIISLKMILGK